MIALVIANPEICSFLYLGAEASELGRECEKAGGCGARGGLASGVWLTSAICNEHEVLIDMTDQLLKKVNYLRTN